MNSVEDEIFAAFCEEIGVSNIRWDNDIQFGSVQMLDICKDLDQLFLSPGEILPIIFFYTCIFWDNCP